MSAKKAPIPLELNGDGVMDLLYAVDAGTDRYHWRYLIGTSGGFAAPRDTDIYTIGAATLIPGSFAGNGRTQFLYPSNGYWYLAGFSGTGLTATSTGLAVAGEYSAADFDGDGLADLMAVSSGSTTPAFSVRRNVSRPSPGQLAVQFEATAQTVWTVPARGQLRLDFNPRIADVNGDGRADIVALINRVAVRDPGFFGTVLYSNGFGNAVSVGPEYFLWGDSSVAIADWNADGCSDLVQVRSILVSDCATGFVPIRTAANPVTGTTLQAVVPTDWNGDGRADLLYIDSATRRWHVVASTGAGAAAPVNTAIPAPTATAWFDMDADGDGLADLAYRDGGNGNRLQVPPARRCGDAAGPRGSFSDGFGMRHSPTYVSIARSHHDRLEDAVFPAVDYQGALYAVSEFSASDGLGGTYRQLYRYEGAQLDLQGRGFLGFAMQRVEDSRSGLVTYDHVARAFPLHRHAPAPRRDQVRRVDDTAHVDGGSRRPAARSRRQRAAQPAAGAADQRAASRTRRRAERHVVSDDSHEFTYGDGFGNPTQVTRIVVDLDPTSPDYHQAWRSDHHDELRQRLERPLVSRPAGVEPGGHDRAGPGARGAHEVVRDQHHRLPHHARGDRA